MSEWKCPKLETVKLYYSGIKKIGSLDLPNLIDIKIYENTIKDLSPMADWKAPKLKTLDVSCC